MYIVLILKERMNDRHSIDIRRLKSSKIKTSIKKKYITKSSASVLHSANIVKIIMFEL